MVNWLCLLKFNNYCTIFVVFLFRPACIVVGVVSSGILVNWYVGITYICIYVYICMYICIHMYVYMYTYVCIYALSIYIYSARISMATILVTIQKKSIQLPNKSVKINYSIL